MIKLRIDELVWRTIEDEIVVLDTRASVYLTLKGSGAHLWPLLAAGAERDDLITTLIAKYGIPRERAARDVDTFLAGLTERQLLDG